MYVTYTFLTTLNDSDKTNQNMNITELLCNEINNSTSHKRDEKRC